MQLLDSGFPDQAVAQFGLVIRFLPGFAEAYLGRARAYIADDHGTLAMRDLNRAVELKPALAIAYLVRGRLHLQMGDDADARIDLDKALSLFEAALVRTDEVNDGAAEARGLLEELN